MFSFFKRQPAPPPMDKITRQHLLEADKHLLEILSKTQDISAPIERYDALLHIKQNSKAYEDVLSHQNALERGIDNFTKTSARHRLLSLVNLSTASTAMVVGVVGYGFAVPSAILSCGAQLMLWHKSLLHRKAEPAPVHPALTERFRSFDGTIEKMMEALETNHAEELLAKQSALTTQTPATQARLKALFDRESARQHSITDFHSGIKNPLTTEGQKLHLAPLKTKRR